ncbi:MAG TPA: amidohydrolase family protein [Candidatus Bathyarchaeia archaeon]|nr:amidohydrolase family protein [Candidatus Bathyarchaeia archaeon]
MSLILKNASLLLGKELSFVERGYVEIGKDGIIKVAKGGPYHRDRKQMRNSTIFDAEGFLITPGFINAHTHIGDSLGKDVAVDSDLDARVNPIYGVKQKILQSKPEFLKTFIRGSALSMLKKGITTFADFREGGPEGVRLLKDAISGLPIKCVVFGRVEYYFDTRSPNSNGRLSRESLPKSALQMASYVLDISDGLGISGANENTDESLQQYQKLIQAKNKHATDKKLLTAIHAAESENTVKLSRSLTGKTEVARITRHLKPDIIIHMTHATKNDVSSVAKKRIGVVVCPRANGIVGAGIPRVGKMLELGCIVGIGSDNVMLNSPDIFRELDYLWKASRSVEHSFLSAREILKMATVNNAEILRLNSGYLGGGRAADIIFIDKSHVDLYPTHNPFASIVHRASQDSIKGVMIDGRFVSGSEFEFANNN